MKKTNVEYHDKKITFKDVRAFEADSALQAKELVK